MRQLIFRLAHGLATLLTAILFVLVIVPKSRLERLLRPQRKPKILWAPTPILNIAINAECDRGRGLQSDTLVYDTYYITQRFDYILGLSKRPAWQRLLLPYGVFLWAAWKYDIFQYYYDRGLLPGVDRFSYNRVELPLLRLAGKGTVISAYGADVRYRKRCEADQPYNCCMDCPNPGVSCVCDVDKAQANFAHVARWAGALISMGDMTEYTPGSRNDIFYWAIDASKVTYVGALPAEGRPVRVVHAPNHRHFKGTRFLLEAVEQLQAEGVAIELDLVEKVPNEEAKKRYAAADIVAEQFIVGWHGFFAIEAMALGKPVICFIRKPEYLPAGKDCPIVSATPDVLKETLRQLAADAELRRDLGERGRRFVEAVYDLPRVGERMATVYQGIYRGPV